VYKTIVVLLILLMAQETMAFSSQYLEDNTLKIPIKQHESNFSIVLQNPDDYAVRFTVDITSNITVTNDKNKDYILQPHTDKSIYLIITTPQDAKLGDTYPVGYRIGEKSLKEGSSLISMGTAISKSFIVKVSSLIQLLNSKQVLSKPIHQKVNGVQMIQV